MRTHVLFEGPSGVIARSDAVVIEGVELPELVSAALGAAQDAERIELCGGIDVADAARVFEAVADLAEVRVNRYGFESLEQVADYKREFASGTAADAAFFYSAPQSSALQAYPGILVAGVATSSYLAEMAHEAQRRGVGIIELYGGLGVTGAATVRRATGDRIPVGFID